MRSQVTCHACQTGVVVDGVNVLAVLKLCVCLVTTEYFFILSVLSQSKPVI